ncbi:MAG: hypothetical protein M1840_000214 [Geoglossum simile]|nr:MAG: hypothetical protein M1840_000214 [Geoglossum simile]
MTPTLAPDGVKTSTWRSAQRQDSISSTSSSPTGPTASQPQLADTNPGLSQWEAAGAVNPMGQKRRGSWAERHRLRGLPWTPRRPLIDFVENGWKLGLEYEYPEIPLVKSRWTAMFRTQRFRRHASKYPVLYLFFFAMCWIGWGLVSQRAEYVGLSRALDGSSRTGRYGTNVRPVFAGMVHIKELDNKLVPRMGRDRNGDVDGGRRLVVVGDVHGCKEELLRLLKKVSFNTKSDHLILAGDIVRKGPDSIGVIELARELGASCVRGNHEDRVLLAYRDLFANHLPLPGPMEDPHAEDDDLDEESFSHGDYKDRKLAKQLNDQQAKWLRGCPLILRVGEIEGMGEVVVVHAGLVPGVELENQDPFNIMNMRTIDRKTLVPSDGRSGVAWAKLWKIYQKGLPSKDRTTVIYGHDSHRGLSIEPYSKGIDTGCVRGGRLTALVIEGGKTTAKQKVVSVKCKNPKRKSKEATNISVRAADNGL